MPCKSLLPLLCAVSLAVSSPLAAQTMPKTDAEPIAKTAPQPADSGKCEPATAQTAESDGTAPSNSGSTGWSGGTGGSQIGTHPSGATPHTKTWHSPTARGLDLKGGPAPSNASC